MHAQTPNTKKFQEIIPSILALFENKQTDKQTNKKHKARMIRWYRRPFRLIYQYQIKKKKKKKILKKKKRNGQKQI